MIESKIIDNIGVIYLSRPKLINALNLDMIRELKEILLAWETDPKVRAVLFDSTSERGFCAGGDIKELYEDITASKENFNKDRFFVEEFDLDKYLMTYKKPIVSHWYGITMGGGIGLTIHSDFIIVDETVNWAMPETRLGFVPDVGVCKNISSLPQALGQYVGLLGKSLRASDLVDYGIADFFIKSSSYKEAIEKLFSLSKNYEGKELINKFSESLKAYENTDKRSDISNDLEKIKKYFSFDSIEEVYHALIINKDDKFASDILDELNQRDPFMLKVQFEKYFVCKDLTSQETIDLDLDIMRYALEVGSMEEGIKAVVIDKSHTPDWPVKSIDKVSDEKVKKLLGIDKTYKEK